MAEKSRVIEHSKVTISTGPLSGVTFATVTNPYGEESPLFPWMPEDGSAVDDEDFKRELCFCREHSAGVEKAFLDGVYSLWREVKGEQDDYHMAIDCW